MRNELANCVLKVALHTGLVLSLVMTGTLSGAEVARKISKPDVPGISNFSQLENATGFAGPTVGFGGSTEPSALALLQEKGYRTIINLRLADEEGVDLKQSREAAGAAGLNYIHLPFDAENPRPGLVDEFLAHVGAQANQPVYIHCGSATRAGALWMIGRLTLDNWSFTAASEEVEMIAETPEKSSAFARGYLDSLHVE